MIRTSMGAGGIACKQQVRGAVPLPPVPEANQWFYPWIAQLGHVGEGGCGYEAPLEAMYRFLVDPEPPLNITTTAVNGVTTTVVEGVDEEVLAARAKFLHPLSKVLIVFLTDEDDCSVLDHGNAWKMGEPEPLGRGTAACATTPESKCCRSCSLTEQAPPAGCLSLAEDASCKQGALARAEDSEQLRCWDQKRRFGESFLFPVERYTAALRAPSLTARDGRVVPNPLFAHGRTPDMVSVLAITGVPWQLLTTEQSQTGPGITDYLSPGALAAGGGWQKILGEPHKSIRRVIRTSEFRLSRGAEGVFERIFCNFFWGCLLH